MLSVDAVQERLICEVEKAVAVELPGTVGAVVSGATPSEKLRLTLLSVALIVALVLLTALSDCTVNDASLAPAGTVSEDCIVIVITVGLIT